MCMIRLHIFFHISFYMSTYKAFFTCSHSFQANKGRFIVILLRQSFLLCNISDIAKRYFFLDRPIAGYANFCPYSVESRTDEEEILVIAKHEVFHTVVNGMHCIRVLIFMSGNCIMHALIPTTCMFKCKVRVCQIQVFSSALYPWYRDENGDPRTPRDENGFPPVENRYRNALIICILQKKCTIY